MLTEFTGLAVFLEQFHEGTGLFVSLVPPSLAPATLLAWGRQHSICRGVVASPKGKKLYLDSLAGLRHQSPNATRALYVTCASGLTHAAVPVRIGQRHVRTVLVGQVFLQKPRSSDFQRLTANLRRAGIQGDFTKCRRAYLETRVAQPRRFHQCVGLVEVFAANLETAPATPAVLPAGAEPTCVSFVKQLIHVRLQQPFQLAHLARESGLCREHFSRQFKRSTGLTVTEYICQARLERAKQLLTDPHKRIAEVAYESGFESVPYFNRVFRRATGLTPTAYRRRQ